MGHEGVSYSGSTRTAALVERLSGFGKALASRRPVDTVIVTAASSCVGIAAIQFAKQVGATVIATTRTHAKHDALNGQFGKIVVTV